VLESVVEFKPGLERCGIRKILMNNNDADTLMSSTEALIKPHGGGFHTPSSTPRTMHLDLRKTKTFNWSRCNVGNIDT
jgi:hypothetical protein